MNRRKLLAFIGLSPLVPFAAKAELEPRLRWAMNPKYDHLRGVMTPSQVDNAFREIMANAELRIQGGYATYAKYSETEELNVFLPDRLVCENHRDKAWPDECDCGPGMRTHKA